MNLRRTIGFFVGALACVSTVAVADDQPANRKATHFTVSVTVVHSTQSPQAAVARVKCEERDDGAKCRVLQVQDGDEREAVCAASSDGTVCWY